MNALEQLGRAIAEEQDKVSPALDTGLLNERLQTSLHAAKSASRRRRWVAGTLLAAAAVSSAVVLVRGYRGSLEYHIEDGEIAGGGSTWISAPDDRQVPIGFSDGSRVVLEHGSRARVTHLERSGAELAVEEGSLRVAIVPRLGNRWRIDLGPFAVDVTGTRFDVAWNPVTERFTLAMHEGKVVVTGCAIGTRTFVAGQVLDVSCRDRQFHIQSSDSIGMSVSSDTAPTEVAKPASPDVRPDRAEEPKPSASAASKWRALAQSGRYGEAIAAAEAAGFESECERASSTDLLALAGAARLTGNASMARQAYTLLRKRFASEPVAAVAAFNLGRVAFDQLSEYTDAARWFRTYLREQPAGSLSREARGRLLEALQRSGDAAGARAAAVDYLDRYPSGPHAEFAKRLAH